MSNGGGTTLDTSKRNGLFHGQEWTARGIRIGIKVSIVFLIFLMASVPLRAQSYREKFQKGSEAYRNQEYEKAARHLRGALEEQETAEVFRLLGHTYFNMDKNRDARNAFLKALKKNEEWTKLHLYIAKTYLRQDHDQKALEHLRTLLEKGGSGEQLFGMYAGIMERNGHYVLAESLYREALLRSRKQALYLRRLIRVSRKQKDDRRALAYVDQLIGTGREIGPKDFVLAAQVALESGRRKRALKELETARYLGASRPDLYRTLADMYLNKEQYRRAVQLYEVLLTLEKSPSPASHYRLGLALLELNRFDRAEEVLRKAAEDSRFADGPVKLARRLYFRRGHDRARRVLDNLLEKYSEYRKAITLRANLAYQEGEYQLAASDYDKLFKKGIRKKTVFMNYARVLRRLEKRTRAVDVLQQALVEFPESDRFFEMLTGAIEKK